MKVSSIEGGAVSGSYIIGSENGFSTIHQVSSSHPEHCFLDNSDKNEIHLVNIGTLTDEATEGVASIAEGVFGSPSDVAAAKSPKHSEVVYIGYLDPGEEEEEDLDVARLFSHNLTYEEWERMCKDPQTWEELSAKQIAETLSETEVELISDPGSWSDASTVTDCASEEGVKFLETTANNVASVAMRIRWTPKEENRLSQLYGSLPIEQVKSIMEKEGFPRRSDSAYKSRSIDIIKRRSLQGVNDSEGLPSIEELQATHSRGFLDIRGIFKLLEKKKSKSRSAVAKAVGDSTSWEVNEVTRFIHWHQHFKNLKKAEKVSRSIFESIKVKMEEEGFETRPVGAYRSKWGRIQAEKKKKEAPAPITSDGELELQVSKSKNSLKTDGR